MIEPRVLQPPEPEYLRLRRRSQGLCASVRFAHLLSHGLNTYNLASALFQWERGELIGKGNFGQVYLALNVTTGNLFAVKQVEVPRTASDRGDARQANVVVSLKHYASIVQDLDHPHIVQYLGFEETPTILSLFLEYVPGGSISGILKNYGRLDENVTKSFTRQTLDGLAYLHSMGIVHRVRLCKFIQCIHSLISSAGYQRVQRPHRFGGHVQTVGLWHLSAR